MNNAAPSISVQCQHFVEPDGSLVCICMRCLLTLARGKDESHLHTDMAGHVCAGDWRLSETPRSQGKL